MINVKQGAAAVLMAFVSVSTLASVAMPVMAQEVSPEQVALARKYLDLTDRAQLFERMLLETGLESMRLLVQQNPEVSEQIDASVKKTLTTFKGRKGELMDQFARVYALQFTAPELQQIVDFYSSPTGTKLATINSTINADLQAVMGVFTNNIKTEFFAQVRADLKAQGIEL